MSIELIGYTDRFSAAPGETIRFMVSTDLSHYETTLVRLIHGDENPDGPGFKEEVVASNISGNRRGRKQIARSGSFVVVDDHASLDRLQSFTLQAWVFPTAPDRSEIQGILSKRSAQGSGFCLALGPDGDLTLSVGGSEASAAERIGTGRALRAREWYFVAAAFDAAASKVRLYQLPLSNWPSDDSSAALEGPGSVQKTPHESGPLLMAAAGEGGEHTGRFAAQGLFNGKIDGPRIFSRALEEEEIMRLYRGVSPTEVAAADLVGAWDFAAAASSARVIDVGPNALHGLAVNMPARAVTGHNWTATEFDFKHAPQQYGAIYFHDDDLEDARWEADFDLVVPQGLPSGVYAAKLTGEGQEDRIPFIVRPPRATANAPILYLIPTMTYVAYANDRMDASQEHFATLPEEQLKRDPRDLYLADHPEFAMSFYDRHSDGSGCTYSSMLRPIPNLRPQYRHLLTTTPRLLGEDLYLIDWLDEKGFAYAVETDHDLHHEGRELLAKYKVIVTGTHPEYWTTPMLTALEAYLEGGGRLMYLGGNGFYWVTSIDGERPHIAEIRRGISGTRAWNSEPGECYHSTTGELGGLWRHRGKTPNRLTGIGFTAQGWGDPAPGYTRKPGSLDPRAAFIFDRVALEETIGDFGLNFGGAAGDEIDRVDYSLGSPPHTLVLATSGPHGPSILPVIEDYLQMNADLMTNPSATVSADMTYFETPNHGAVFSVGSICWCGSLSHNNYDNNVSRVTENVLTAFANSDKLPPPAGD